jgi:hypothetical protein
MDLRMYQAKPPPNYLRTRQTNQNNQKRRPRFETEAAKPKGQPTESETQPTNTKGRCAGELCVHKSSDARNDPGRQDMQHMQQDLEAQ